MGAFWIAPVALSINTARTAPQTARLVPVDLPDRSISPTPGSKLSYLGYEFEIPWTDLDDTQTKRYPDQVILTFRSGCRLMMGVSLPKFWITNLGKLTLSPAIATVQFGPDALQSDYRFLEALYDFTPDKMHPFAIRPSTHYREAYLLTLKSAALSRHARSGFFNIEGSAYKGFQQGDPGTQSSVLLELYGDSGSVHFTFFPDEQTHQNLNRVAQSLRSTP